MSDNVEDDWPDDLTTRVDQQANAEQLVVNISGFEGPMDVLLTLARAQKVDLLQISILELVEQYLEFVAAARRVRIELAADYLVMAAWLAYLKSRLLLPREDDEEEPSAEELALRLQLRLQRLDAMRDMGARIMARDRLGRELFPRGAPEGLAILRKRQYDISFYDMLKAYGDIRQRSSISQLRIERRPVFALEDAIERLGDLIGTKLDWAELADFLPPQIGDPRLRRSAVASHFAASLELVRQGIADIRQTDTFGPLYMRRRQIPRDDNISEDT